MIENSMPTPGYTNIDEYIDACVPAVQPVLRELRAFIKNHAPDATEKISYSMPCFYQNGNLVYFAAQKKHIGFYPCASGIANFTADFEALGLKYSKGAVRFPLDAPLPWELIARIVEFRVRENVT